MTTKTKQTEMSSLFPHGPFMAEIPKAVGKIGLVAGAFEAKHSAEVNQGRFVHFVAVITKKHQYYI
jgi:hypothetical protein